MRWLYVPIAGAGYGGDNLDAHGEQIWDNHEKGPWRPKVPSRWVWPDTKYTLDSCNIIEHYTSRNETGKRKLLNRYVRIGVPEKLMPELGGWEWYDENDSRVPFLDKQLNHIIRACGYLPDEHEAIVNSEFDSIGGELTTFEKRVAAKEVLLELVHRGLSAEKAEVIRQRLGLPETIKRKPGSTS